MELGIIANSNEEYHAGPGVSVSDLKVLLHQTPLHLWARKFDPARKPQTQTPAKLLGSAIHCATLEPDDFPYRYAVVPEGIDRRSKIGKEFYQELEAGGQSPLTAEQYAAVMSTSTSLRTHPIISYLLSLHGKVEQSMYWRDKATGVICRMRPDYMIEPCSQFPNGLILDLKSAEDASPVGFAKAAYNYAYHMQAAWYPDGFQQIFGTREAPAFIFGSAEKEAPFAAAVYSASAEQIRLGRYHNRRLLEQYAQCLAADQWPGFNQEASPLALPAWGAKELDELQAAGA